MRKVVKYFCDFCNQEFDSELDCRKHEDNCFDYSTIKFFDEDLNQLPPKVNFDNKNFGIVYGMIIPDRRSFDFICKSMEEANESFVDPTIFTTFPVKLWYDENVMDWVCVEDKVKELSRSKEAFESVFEVKSDGN